MDAPAAQSGSLVHLHVHSEYSLMDGAIRISDLVKQAKAMGHNAVALTDHGSMFGAIEFYTAAKDAGIKAILGAEIYHEVSPLTQELSKGSERSVPICHLTILARDNDGYKSLIRMVSRGYLDGAQEVPVVRQARLKEFAQGIIALSGCMRGELGYLAQLLVKKTAQPFEALTAPDEEAAPIVAAMRDYIQTMQQLFGADGFYIELIDNGLPEQKQMLPLFAAIAQTFNVPLVATADAHYLKPKDKEAHVVLTAIKNELNMSKIRDRRQDTTFHLYSNEEMQERYGTWPEALANTQRIADACHVKLEFGKYFLPRFDTPNNETEADAMHRMAKEGLAERLVHLKALYGEWLTPEREQKYWERLDFECGVINSMGFPGYFLIVQDFINWAKNHNIPVGPGRGSGAGSLVAYALRITDLDPLKLNLIFERFLNPERISMPDFDVDFCQWRRDEVIQYVTQKYGSENVAQITTFGKMKAKAALRDVGRVLEISYGKVDRVAKLIPNEIDIKLKDALEREPRINEEAQRDPAIKDMIDIALQIEGLSRHTSVHAAGVVISEGGMENYVPVYTAEGSALITQYEMKNAEKVGLVKFDFLGLKTLTVIEKAVQLVRASRDPQFDIANINTEKRDVYQVISAGHTVGIFQLEGSGMQALAMKLKPSCFEDIVAMVALYRPGPLGSGMVDDFIERKHGRQQIAYPVPDLEPILQETYGIILYQEQVQKIAAVLASYSLGEADLLRRAMGKKKPEEMAKQKARFVEGSVKNGHAEGMADALFDLMAKFAEYGFNKSHSAAYGLVAYQTAYMKAYFPEQFMAAILTCDLDNSEKVVRYIEDCRRMKFKILPPDINRSILDFDVPEPQSIGFGLAAIKGIGAGSIEEIVNERQKNGPFVSLTDLAVRVNLHRAGKKTLELLIEAGALDSFGFTRSRLMAAVGELVKFSEEHHAAQNAGQMSLFGETDADSEAAVQFDMENEKILAKEEFVHAEEWLHRERALLGVFLSGHPIDLYRADADRFGKFMIKDIPNQVGQKKQPIVAVLNEISERLTKTGKRMAYVHLEDTTGQYECVMFENEFPPQMPTKDCMVVAYVSVNKSFDGSGLSVRVDGLKTLQDVRRELVKKASFSLPSGQLGGGQSQPLTKVLQSLEQIVRRHPGRTFYEVNLRFQEGVVKIQPGTGGVDLSDQLLNEIRQLANHQVGLLY